MRAVFLVFAAMIMVAAACPDGFTTTNDHCVDAGNCLVNNDCPHGEECCFPTNGACDSQCFPHGA